MAVPETAAAAAAAWGRKGLVDIIRMAHDTKRHSEMFVYLKKLAEMHAEMRTEFNAEERKLFVIAYRCIFSAMLRALGVISAKEGQDDPEKAKRVMFYRSVLERDIQAMCRQTLDIVDKHLLPFSCAAENTVLCTNMKADAYCFVAMLKVEEDNKQLHIDKALKAYEAASKAAESLSEAHPLRHALHLTKTAALFYDVKEWPELATALQAKLAPDMAGPELHSLDEGSYKKIAETIGIMEENLKLWEPTGPNIEESFKKSAEVMGPIMEEKLKLKLWEPTSPNSKDYSEPSSENNISSKASLSLEEEYSYSGGSPSPHPPPPVVPRPAGPPVAPDVFISPGDWGYEVHEALTQKEIRFRKKAAQIKRGFMG